MDKIERLEKLKKQIDVYQAEINFLDDLIKKYKAVSQNLDLNVLRDYYKKEVDKLKLDSFTTILGDLDEAIHYNKQLTEKVYEPKKERVTMATGKAGENIITGGILEKKEKKSEKG